MSSEPTDPDLNEERKLEAALYRADELVAQSLRKDEHARRDRKRTLWWIAAVVAAFGMGVVVGIVSLRTPSTRSTPVVYDHKLDETPTSGRVEAKWGMRWYQATIIRIEDGLFLVRYDGRGEHLDEWVTKERVRQIGSTREIGYAKPNPPGEKPVAAKSASTTP